MAWIESHEHLEKNGRLLKLADILGINIYQAIGHLHAFWWWATHNTGRNGDLSGISPLTISRAAGWDRYVLERKTDHFRGPNDVPETYAFCHALILVGFIDIQSDEHVAHDDALGANARIHQWEKYSARYFDWIESIENRRESERLRQRLRRKLQKKRTHFVTHQNDTSVRDSTRPNLTKPNIYKRIKRKVQQQNAAPLFNFEEVWEQYPNKLGKKQAERHFRNSVKTQEDADLILKALMNYKMSERVKGGYVQNGSTWFNNWRDWIDYKEKKPYANRAGSNSGLDKLFSKKSGEIRPGNEVDTLPPLFGGMAETVNLPIPEKRENS